MNAHLREMNVRVDETGQDEAAAQIANFGIGMRCVRTVAKSPQAAIFPASTASAPSSHETSAVGVVNALAGV
jgi:hypothetical protein